MIARLRHGEERQRDCRQSRGDRQRGVAAFERRHRALEIGDRRQSMQAVADAGILATLGRLEIGDAIEEHRRRTVHRRVDRAEVLLRIATEMGDFGCRPRLAPLAHATRANAAAICAACASAVCRMSITIACSGSSSAAN